MGPLPSASAIARLSASREPHEREVLGQHGELCAQLRRLLERGASLVEIRLDLRPGGHLNCRYLHRLLGFRHYYRFIPRALQTQHGTRPRFAGRRE